MKDEELKLNCLEETKIEILKGGKIPLFIELRQRMYLVVESGQFKARHGLELTESSRDISFCGHAINGREIFEVRDASKDSRFADNPFVTGPAAVRFYAGAPLQTPAGTVVGTLCVIGSAPGALNPDQLTALESLSKIVVRELESRKTLKSTQGLFADLQARIREVEEQRELLVQADKLKSLGEIAGGIAHEINTPLYIIKSNAESLVRRIESSQDLVKDELLQKINKIDKTVTRISDLTKGMLLFSRSGVVDDIDTVHASQIIESAVALIRGSSNRTGIEIILDPSDDVKVVCSQQKALQVVINLLSNALDALDNLEEKWIRIGTRVGKTPGFSEIYVTDSGQGIPPELREKILEPFFSTKPVGKGTGLGLSLSQKLAKAQKGSLYIDNSSSTTTFVLSLPSQ